MKRPDRKDYVNKKSKVQLIADLELYVDYLEDSINDCSTLTLKCGCSIFPDEILNN